MFVLIRDPIFNTLISQERYIFQIIYIYNIYSTFQLTVAFPTLQIRHATITFLDIDLLFVNKDTLVRLLRVY